MCGSKRQVWREESSKKKNAWMWEEEIDRTDWKQWVKHRGGTTCWIDNEEFLNSNHFIIQGVNNSIATIWA